MSSPLFHPLCGRKCGLSSSLEAEVCVPTECPPCGRWMQLGGRLLWLLFPFRNCHVCESLIIAYWGSRLLPPQQRACCLVFVISGLFFFPPSTSLVLPHSPSWDCLLLTLVELGLPGFASHRPRCTPSSELPRSCHPSALASFPLGPCSFLTCPEAHPFSSGLFLPLRFCRFPPHGSLCLFSCQAPLNPVCTSS